MPYGDLSNKDDLMKYAVPGEECLRACVKGEQKVCNFQFKMENYQVLGGFVEF